MGTYVTFKAKPGCEDQINSAYIALTGNKKDMLVYSDEIIKGEIAFIHSAKGKGQAHLRPYLKTVSDWEKIFPVCASGTGQIKVSGIECDDVEEHAITERDIKFVLANRFLFSEIKGLDDARRLGFTEFSGDYIENSKTLIAPPSTDPTFADLPKATSAFYLKCVEYGRPDLWCAYLKFKNDLTYAAWEDLRTKVIPWKSGFSTVWQLVEQAATERDGKEFGLMGRFCDGVIPALTMVRKAVAA